MQVVWLFRPPGVYRPQEDTWLLAESLRTVTTIGLRVLDVGTGTGALALTAARGGAGQVVAVDISARAVFAARVNAWVRRLPVRVLHSDLFEAVTGESFDLIVANPPYVRADGVPTRRSADRWYGGPGGRTTLDRLCTAAPAMLTPGGMLLVVQSELSGVSSTVERLRSAGLRTAVVTRRRAPFGRIMRANAAQLEGHGVIGPGQRYEELVVIRGERIA